MEKIPHQDIQNAPYRDLQNIPLSYRDSYGLHLITAGGQEALCASPADRIPLAAMRKQHHQLPLLSGKVTRSVCLFDECY